MKKRTILIVGLVVAVLVIVVGVTAYLNMGNFKEKKEMEKSAVILIKSGGKELARVDMEYIKGLGEEEFSVNLDTSETDPEEHIYTGVPMKNLFNAFDIDINKKSSVIARAIDGYTIAFDIEEVLEEENIYIAYKMDGELLGSKSDGDSGPYQIIVRKDPFSQRWCKFLTEVELQ